jgi:hypothetical protein
VKDCAPLGRTLQHFGNLGKQFLSGINLLVIKIRERALYGNLYRANRRPRESSPATSSGGIVR